MSAAEVVFPTPGLQSPFDVYLLAISEAIPANLCQRTPGDDVEPFLLFVSLALG